MEYLSREIIAESIHTTPSYELGTEIDDIYRDIDSMTQRYIAEIQDQIFRCSEEIWLQTPTIRRGLKVNHPDLSKDEITELTRDIILRRILKLKESCNEEILNLKAKELKLKKDAQEYVNEKFFSNMDYREGE